MQDVAMGAAYACADSNLISRRTALHFGVWRVEHGEEWFDVLVPRGQELDPEQPLEHQVSYKPTHDIGAFRFCQCSELVDAEGNELSAAELEGERQDVVPAGDVCEYPSSIRVPFKEGLRQLPHDELSGRTIGTTAPTVAVTESYPTASSLFPLLAMKM